MPAAIVAAPTAALIIVTVVAVLAVAGIAGVLLVLRRSGRLSGATIGVSAVVAVAIVAGAVLVGGSLATPAPAAAVQPSKGVGQAYDPAIVGVQLPTLDLP
jgi:hypothetical protein